MPVDRFVDNVYKVFSKIEIDEINLMANRCQKLLKDKLSGRITQEQLEDACFEIMQEQLKAGKFGDNITIGDKLANQYWLDELDKWHKRKKTRSQIPLTTVIQEPAKQERMRKDLM